MVGSSGLILQWVRVKFALMVVVVDLPLVREAVEEGVEELELGYSYPFRLMEVRLKGVAVEDLVGEEWNMAGVANVSSVYRVNRGEGEGLHLHGFVTEKHWEGLSCLSLNAMHSTEDMLSSQLKAVKDMELMGSVVRVVLPLQPHYYL